MNKLNGNNFIIFGDSYSTYEGYIPDGYKHFYSKEGRDGRPVSKMEQNCTWWARLIQETGMNLVLNDSWSGSTICYTGYEGDCSQTNSFIYRLRKHIKEGFFDDKKIDIVFLFGGTNDYWVGAPLGIENAENYEEKDLFQVYPAMACMMKEARAQFKDSQIYFIINSELNPEINEFIKKNSYKYDVKYIELKDIDKIDRHPTPEGMKSICDQIVQGITK